MNPKWAEENLQTIRTLMERSALYRRALAPIMIFTGAMGIIGGLAGWRLHVDSNSGFLWLWIGVAIISLIGGLFLIRRQALKDSESFWSPPTRRVAQALAPAFFIGLAMAILSLISLNQHPIYEQDTAMLWFLVILWAWLYGCAIHAAGFFMPRGVRWLGWLFIIAGFFITVSVTFSFDGVIKLSPHLLMSAIFGGLHLAYGIYLYFTEKKHPAA
jgi:hypothetical protein